MLSIAASSAYHDSDYVIVYKHEIYKIAQHVKSPKIAVPDEYRNAIGKDSVDFMETFQFPYVINVEMRITPKGNYSYKEWSTNPLLPLSNNKTKFYKDRKFYTGDDSTATQPLNIRYKKVKGSKSILGYTCVKFIGTNQDTKEIYEMWVTRQLPQSITGLFQLSPFGYAVLEIQDSQGFWKRTATSIERPNK